MDPKTPVAARGRIQELATTPVVVKPPPVVVVPGLDDSAAEQGPVESEAQSAAPG